MANDINSRKHELHGWLVEDGATFGGKTDYASFENALADPERARKMYDWMISKKYDLDDFDTFYEDFGPGKNQTGLVGTAGNPMGSHVDTDALARMAQGGGSGNGAAPGAQRTMTTGQRQWFDNFLDAGRRSKEAADRKAAEEAARQAEARRKAEEERARQQAEEAQRQAEAAAAESASAQEAGDVVAQPSTAAAGGAPAQEIEGAGAPVAENGAGQAEEQKPQKSAEEIQLEYAQTVRLIKRGILMPKVLEEKFGIKLDDDQFAEEAEWAEKFIEANKNNIAATASKRFEAAYNRAVDESDLERTAQIQMNGTAGARIKERANTAVDAVMDDLATKFDEAIQENLKKNHYDEYQEGIRRGNMYGGDRQYVDNAWAREKFADPKGAAQTAIDSIGMDAIANMACAALGIDNTDPAANAEGTVAKVNATEAQLAYVNTMITKTAEHIVNRMYENLYNRYKENNKLTSVEWMVMEAMKGSMTMQLADMLVNRLQGSALQKLMSNFGGDNGSQIDTQMLADRSFAEYMPNEYEQGAAMAGSLFMDSWAFKLGGAGSQAAGRAATMGTATGLGRMLGSRTAGMTAMRAAMANPITRATANIAGRMVASGMSFGGFETIAKAVEMMGDNNTYDLWDVVSNLAGAYGKGFGTGTVLGVIGGIPAEATAGMSIGARVAGDVLGFGGELAYFSGSEAREYMEANGLEWEDVPLSSIVMKQATMLGLMKAQHIGDIVERYNSPLTKRMGMELTSDDLEQIKRHVNLKGNSAWSIMRAVNRLMGDKYKFMEDADLGEDFAIEDGAYEQIMRDPNVSLETKNKIRYIFGAKMGAIGTTFDNDGKVVMTMDPLYGAVDSKYDDETGEVILYASDGTTIAQRRQFKNWKEAMKYKAVADAQIFANRVRTMRGMAKMVDPEAYENAMARVNHLAKYYNLDDVETLLRKPADIRSKYEGIVLGSLSDEFERILDTNEARINEKTGTAIEGVGAHGEEVSVVGSGETAEMTRDAATGELVMGKAGSTEVVSEKTPEQVVEERAAAEAEAAKTPEQRAAEEAEAQRQQVEQQQAELAQQKADAQAETERRDNEAPFFVEGEDGQMVPVQRAEKVGNDWMVTDYEGNESIVGFERLHDGNEVRSARESERQQAEIQRQREEAEAQARAQAELARQQAEAERLQAEEFQSKLDEAIAQLDQYNSPTSHLGRYFELKRMVDAGYKMTPEQIGKYNKLKEVVLQDDVEGIEKKGGVFVVDGVENPDVEISENTAGGGLMAIIKPGTDAAAAALKKVADAKDWGNDGVMIFADTKTGMRNKIRKLYAEIERMKAEGAGAPAGESGSISGEQLSADQIANTEPEDYEAYNAAYDEFTKLFKEKPESEIAVYIRDAVDDYNKSTDNKTRKSFAIGTIKALNDILASRNTTTQDASATPTTAPTSPAKPVESAAAPAKAADGALAPAKPAKPETDTRLNKTVTVKEFDNPKNRDRNPVLYSVNPHKKYAWADTKEKQRDDAFYGQFSEEANDLLQNAENKFYLWSKGNKDTGLDESRRKVEDYFMNKASRKELEALEKAGGWHQLLYLDIMWKKHPDIMAQRVNAGEGDAAAKHNEEVKRNGGLIDNKEKANVPVGTQNLLERIGRQLGIQFECVVDGRPGVYGSWSNDGKRVIKINVVAGINSDRDAMYWTIGHEITHSMRQTDKAVWNAFKDIVKATVGEDVWNERVEQAKKDYKGVQGYNTEDDFVEEVVCDFVGQTLWHDEAFVQKVVRDAAKVGKDPKTLIQKVLKWFDKIKAEIQKIIGSGNATDDLKELDTRISQAKDMWQKMYNIEVAQQNERVAEREAAEAKAAKEAADREAAARLGAKEYRDAARNDGDPLHETVKAMGIESGNELKVARDTYKQAVANGDQAAIEAAKADIEAALNRAHIGLIEGTLESQKNNAKVREKYKEALTNPKGKTYWYYSESAKRWMSAEKGVRGARADKDLTAEERRDILSVYGRELPDDIKTTLEIMERVYKRKKAEAKKAAKQVANMQAQTGEGTTKMSLRNIEVDGNPDDAEWRKKNGVELRDAYKLMRLDENGQLQTLYIGRENYEVGQWYNGDSPDMSMLEPLEQDYFYLFDEDYNVVDKKPIKYQKNNKIAGLKPSEVKAANDNNQRWMAVGRYANGDRRYANMGINGAEGVTDYALRPGIHAGSLPSMQQIGSGTREEKAANGGKPLRDDNLIWVKGKVMVGLNPEEMAELEQKGEIQSHIPSGGYIKGTSSFVTKGMDWFITNAFKPEEIISDSEARRVIDEYNANREEGTEEIPYDYNRRGGRMFNAETMRLEEAGGDDLNAESQTQRTEQAAADLEEDGLHVAESGVSGERLSIRYSPKNKEEVAKEIDDIMKTTGRSKAVAKRWVDSQMSLANIFGNEMFREYLDYKTDDTQYFLKTNSDYPQGSIDFNNICRKRIPATYIWQRLQHDNPNRILTARDLAEMVNVMKEEGLEVPCAPCFVEDRRQKLGEIAKMFIDAAKDNFEEYGGRNQTKAAVAEKLREILKDYTPEELEEILSIDKLITLDGNNELREEYPEVYRAFMRFNNARGQQAGRLFLNYAEYKREILDWDDDKVKSINDDGGLRIFSTSDFEAHHLLDIVQIVQDCAVRGIKIQGYTKVPAFARAMAKTGAKINMSLIPAGVGYHMVDGKPVLDFDPVEGIDINSEDYKAISKDNPNVGTIIIGINDEHIRYCMTDPEIDYIIPFHSGLPMRIRDAKGIGEWKNYKLHQTEKKNGKAVGHNEAVNIYTDVIDAAIANGEPIQNKVDFVNKYLQVCKERGMVPKYAKFLDKDAEGNYVYTEGYHKFLIDFKLFDKEGNMLPFEAVKPEFDDELNRRIVDDYIKDEQIDRDYEPIIQRVKERLGLSPAGDAAEVPAGNTAGTVAGAPGDEKMSVRREVRDGDSAESGTQRTERGLMDAAKEAGRITPDNYLEKMYDFNGAYNRMKADAMRMVEASVDARGTRSFKHSIGSDIYRSIKPEQVIGVDRHTGEDVKGIDLYRAQRAHVAPVIEDYIKALQALDVDKSVQKDIDEAIATAERNLAEVNRLALAPLKRQAGESAKDFAQRVMDDYTNNGAGARGEDGNLIKRDGESYAEFARRVANDDTNRKERMANDDTNPDDDPTTPGGGGGGRPTERMSIRPGNREDVERSKEFKGWFGDWENEPRNASKVVDENGKPLVVYHGTTNEFGTFEADRIGSSSGNIGFWGRGFYFTPDRDIAEEYSEGKYIKSVYLNIKNPFYLSEIGPGFNVDMNEEYSEESYDKMRTAVDLIRIYREFPDVSKRINVYDGKTLYEYAEGLASKIGDGTHTVDEIADAVYAYDPEYKVSALDNGASFGGTMARVFTNHPELTEEIKSRGYDGIISDEIDREYVVFDPNQIMESSVNGEKFSLGRPMGPSETPESETRDRMRELNDAIDKMMADQDWQQDPTTLKWAPTKDSAVSIQKLVADVEKFVRERLTKEIGEEMGSKNIKSLLSQIKYAATVRDLREPMRQIQRMINEAQMKRDSKEMMDLLSTRMQKKNDSGILVGAKVDEGIRRVVETVKRTWATLTDKTAPMSSAAMEQEITNDEIAAIQRIDDALNNGLTPKPEDVDEAYFSIPARRHANQIKERMEDQEAAANAWRQAMQDLVDFHKTPEYRKAKGKQSLGHALDPDDVIALNKDEALRNAVWAAEDDYLSKQREVADEVYRFNQHMKGIFAEGSERRKQIAEAKMQHKKDLLDAALGDFKRGEQLLEFEGKESMVGKAWRKAVDVMYSPLMSLDFLLKNAPNYKSGAGRLYRHFFLDPETSIVAAEQNKFKGIKELRGEVESKIEEIWGDRLKQTVGDRIKNGKLNVWDRLHDDSIKELKTTIHRNMTAEEAEEYNRRQEGGRDDWQEGDVYDIEGMTKGSALYAWLTWRQPHGRIKMMKQGYTQQTIDEIEAALGTEYLQLGEWITEELLPRTRADRYNPKHIEIYGTSMSNHEHYFPLKISRLEITPDKGMETLQTPTMPSVASPYNIARTNSTAAVEVEKSNALDILDDYINTQENWLAFADVVADENTLMASKAFKRALESNRTGAYQTLMDAFRVATGTLIQKDRNVLSDIASGAVSAWGGSRIAFRFYTAVKQLTSYPAFMAYSGNARFQAELAANFTKPKSCMEWAYKNLPLYEKRSDSGDMGYEGLNEGVMAKRAMRRYSNAGMAANRYFDRWAVACGAKTVYDECYRNKYKQYKAQGLSDDEAKSRAHAESVIEATICFNESQQSNVNAFSAKVQKDQGSWERLLMMFRNSVIGYGRQFVTGANDVRKAAKGGILDENDMPVGQRARRKLAASGLGTMAVFGAVLPAIWGLAGNTSSLWGGLDDEEQKSVMTSVLLGMLSDYTAAGSPISALSNGYDVTQFALASDIKYIVNEYKKKDSTAWGVTKKIAEYVSTNVFGFNPQTWTNIYEGTVGMVQDAIEHGDTLPADLALDAMIIMNMSKTDREGWAREMYKKYGPVAFANAMDKAQTKKNAQDHALSTAKNWAKSVNAEFAESMEEARQIVVGYNKAGKNADKAAYWENLTPREQKLFEIFCEYDGLLLEASRYNIDSQLSEEGNNVAVFKPSRGYKGHAELTDQEIQEALKSLIEDWEKVKE